MEERIDLVQVENAIHIRGGDELRNINSYEYLLNVYMALQGILRDSPFTKDKDPLKIRLPKEFFPLNKIYELFSEFHAYNPRYAYGDLYTRFILDLEDNLANIKKYIENEARKEDSNPQRIELLTALYTNGIKIIYANPNLGLERSGKMVEDILESTLHTESVVEKSVTKRMKRGSGVFSSSINKTTPQQEGSGMGRFSAMVSSDFKPQSTTSMASIRVYDYKLDQYGRHRTDLPLEYRFGTQGQYHGGNPRVSPLFKGFLEVQKKDREANPPIGPTTRITHIYFNNLGLDRSGYEGNREKRLTEQLHQLERDHDNVAVITLPADKGLMDKHLIEDHRKIIQAKDAFKDMVNIANGTSDRNVKDFYISDDIKKLLYGVDRDTGGYDKDNEEIVLHRLLVDSFKKLGLYGQDVVISPSEMQAIYFHFIKYELTNYIIETLKPASFNMSCKDAIDRGGVSSAYYNVMKSLELGQPMSKEEFYRALHAAPTLVKGRGMNHHSKLIWNAVDKYLNGPHGGAAPAWLVTWRKDHAPSNTKVHLLEALDNYLLERTQDSRVKFLGGKFDKGTKVNAATKLRALINNPDDETIIFTPKEWDAMNDKRLSKIVSKMLETGYVKRENIRVEGRDVLSHSM